MACLPQAYLAVRSFAKGEAFLYKHWYGRVAQHPYSLEPSHAHDHHRHFTVSCYDPDEAVRSQQARPPYLSWLMSQAQRPGWCVLDMQDCQGLTQAVWESS